jgi:hypothetical protein
LDINKLVKDLSDGLDNLFTSDEERLKYALKLAELRSNVVTLRHELQVKMSKTKLYQRIGYGITVAYLYDIFVGPMLRAKGIAAPDLNEAELLKMLFKMIGIG